MKVFLAGTKSRDWILKLLYEDISSRREWQGNNNSNDSFISCSSRERESGK